jgi:hypothetical protein
MGTPLSEKVLARLDSATELYHRLVLVAAPSGSGKTAALQDIAKRTGAPLLNLNLEVSRSLLDLTGRQRALQLPRVLEEVVGRAQPLVLLDNIEILFDVTLEQDPLRLLQGLSRNRTVVASWNGPVDNGYLSYATPEHPEYRRYPARDLVVVCPEVAA